MQRAIGEVEAVIMDFIRNEIRGGQCLDIDPEENLFTSGLVDSVGIMRLIAHLQSTYRMTIPPVDLVPRNFRTVRVMAEYIHRTSFREG